MTTWRGRANGKSQAVEHYLRIDPASGTLRGWRLNNGSYVKTADMPIRCELHPDCVITVESPKMPKGSGGS